jgi:glutamyl-Q tRNA(Asp) synthetase
LNAEKAAALLSGKKLYFNETGARHKGNHPVDMFVFVNGVGDIIVARRDMGTSYHLSVVVDDAAQGITHVIRGEDLFGATRIHVVLQALLDLPTPVYHHHRLIRDDHGNDWQNGTMPVPFRPIAPRA